MQTKTQLLARLHVPENAFAGDVPLVAVHRGEYVAGLHRGTLAAVDPSGHTVLAFGDIGQSVFLRSAAKPFQVMPAILAGAVERFHITERELSVLCASHHAEPVHVEAVSSVLAKLGLDESALRCGIHSPISPTAAASLLRAGEPPRTLHNNCSGAHTGLLAACVVNGWPIDSYGDPDHPVQVSVRAVLASFSGIAAGEIEFAVDNCAIPTFRLPVQNAALAFARLATGEKVAPDLRSAAHQVVSAMTHYPEMVGGQASFDTALMRAAGDRLVSKGGAEGFAGVGLLQARLGLALKITDGAAAAVPPAVITALDALDPLSVVGHLPLETHRSPEIHDHRGSVVGCLRAVFAVERPD